MHANENSSFGAVSLWHLNFELCISAGIAGVKGMFWIATVIYKTVYTHISNQSIYGFKHEIQPCCILAVYYFGNVTIMKTVVKNLNVCALAGMLLWDCS